MASSIKALLFDVFGTIVDWRTGITREGEEFGRAYGLTGIDWTTFADEWRGMYQPSLEKVRSGKAPWQPLDNIHRAELNHLLEKYRIQNIAEADIDHFNRAWHRLPPWPDAVPGLVRMKKKYILAPCSNGNVSMMVHLARQSGLPWDVILGAEMAQQYKPVPIVYQKSVALLRIDPAECVLVAAHNYDLEAAVKCGLKAAFVPRLKEFGAAGKPDLKPSQQWDFVVEDFSQLAQQLGC